MIDANSQFFAILTAVGEAKQVKADAGLMTWKLTHMAVGDANNTDPIPDRLQKVLINERRRAPLNMLGPDPANPGILVAEQIIPSDEGGFWIRELGLFDSDGDLVAVANCAPSFKPKLSQGAGRTQTVRMNFIVKSSTNVVLNIDPSVVTATRRYVDESIAGAINKLDFKQSVLVATTGPVVLAGVQAIDGFAVPVGSRVLVKDQAQAKDNGLYVVGADSWVRSVDADTSDKVTPGLMVTVERGTVNADTVWQLVSDGPLVLGTSSLAFQWLGGQNAPTPPVDDRSKRVANTESVMTQIESQNQVFPAHVFRKNRLINGNFDIWQRGTSGQVGNASGPPQAVYGPDRWIVYMPTNSSATWDRIAFELGGGFDEGRYALRVTRSGTSAGLNISQKIEGVESCAGKAVTISFYMRSSVNHKCGVILRHNFGAGGSDGGAGVGEQINVTTEFKKFVVNLAVPSIKGKQKGSAGDYLELVFGSTGEGSYNVDLARVQLEQGFVSTEFELRPLGAELELCQRYFEKTFSQGVAPKDGVDVNGALISVVYAGQGGSSSQPVSHWAFKVEKRTVPSVRLYRAMGGGADGQWRSGSDVVSSQNARSLIVGTRQASVDNSDVGIAAQTYYIHATADAEL